MVLKKTRVSGNTCYRWWKEFGGLTVDQAQQLKDLKVENPELKRLVATDLRPRRLGGSNHRC